MASETPKVAVVTGGSSGMGLDVVQALAARGGWQIHIIDIKEAEGKEIAASTPNVYFHKGNLTDYAELGAAFMAAFIAGGHRLDFCFANAGALERANFYSDTGKTVQPPPEMNMTNIDINLKGCINTVHLARHYIRQSPANGGSIVVSSSCSGLWPNYAAPMYAAAKHGVNGIVRSIADWYWKSDRIRVNAVCPGAVKTPIIPMQAWKSFPDHVFTPIEIVTKVVLMLADGEEIVDAKGVRVPPEEAHGQTILANGQKYYVIAPPEYSDELAEVLTEGTRVEKQAGYVLEKE